jgi:hypothetical protein
MAGLVPAVRRVDLNEEICYESSLSRIQASGSEDVVELCDEWGAVPMNVQSPGSKSKCTCGDEIERVLSRRCFGWCETSNADAGGNDCGISLLTRAEMLS